MHQSRDIAASRGNPQWRGRRRPGKLAPMNQTTFTEGAPARPARLERAREGRMVAGVCAGLARQLDVDVTLVRIVVVVATMIGGVGVVAYAAAFLLIPEQGQPLPLARMGDQRSRAVLVAGAALIALGAATMLDNFGIGWHQDLFWGALLVAGGAFLLLRTREVRDGLGPLAADGERAWPAGDVVPPVTAAAPTAATAVADPPPPPAGPPPPDEPPPPGPPPGPGASTIVLGAVLVGAGALLALGALTDLDLGWAGAAGIVVVLAGGALIGGSFFGASPALVIPALALAAAVGGLQAAGVQLHGGIGDRTYRPTSAPEVRDRYRLAVGDLRVDLRDVALPDGPTRVHASLGVGELRVYVPRDTLVRVHAHAGAGNVLVFGREEDGVDVDADRVTGSGARELLLDADVGLGEVRVIAAGELRLDDPTAPPVLTP
jgi:phage shock protein PspC (stress-responsive transcriptional regulator)